MRLLQYFAFTALGVSLAAGCGGSLPTHVPSDVTQRSEELRVSDRASRADSLLDESFTLGDYRVSEVNRRWKSTRTDEIFDFEQSRARGGYAYELSAGERRLVGGCSTAERQSWQATALVTVDAADSGGHVAKLGCSCEDGDAETNLILDTSTAAQYEGAVIGDDYVYDVTAIMPGESAGSSSADPLGYRLDRGGDGPIGAIDVVRPGRAWLRKNLPEPQRRQLACVFAGLLLYEHASVEPADER